MGVWEFRSDARTLEHYHWLLLVFCMSCSWISQACKWRMGDRGTWIVEHWPWNMENWSWNGEPLSGILVCQLGRGFAWALSGLSRPVFPRCRDFDLERNSCPGGPNNTSGLPPDYLRSLYEICSGFVPSFARSEKRSKIASDEKLLQTRKLSSWVSLARFAMAVGGQVGFHFRCLFAKRSNHIICNTYRTGALFSPCKAFHLGIKNASQNHVFSRRFPGLTFKDFM